ncbi:MAG: flagellar hook-associated protein FlgK [Lachnospiraceae bacterium]
MPLMGSLYIGSSGLQTSQNALNTTAHNMTNIDTKGYVRQQVLLGNKEYNRISTNTRSVSNQQVGLGVNYSKTRQVRDYFLDQAYRKEAGRSQFYATSTTSMSEVETLMGEMYGKAFGESLSGLKESVSELVKSPTDPVRRDTLMQRADAFIRRASAVYKGLTDYQDNLNLQVKQTVNTINDYGQRIKKLNEQIVLVQAGVESPNDLIDARNQLLDELSGLANIEYEEDQFGSMMVSIEGEPFVSGDRIYEMGADMDETTGFYTPFWPHRASYTLNQDGSKQYSLEDGGKVFDLTQTVSSDLDTDIGKLKSLVLSRGDHHANYADIADTDHYNKNISQSIVMNVQAEFDQLIHNVTTKINEVIRNAAIEESTRDPGSKYLRGADGNPLQIFQKKSTNGYDAAGNYIPEFTPPALPNAKDTANLYTITNLQINPELMQNPSLLSFMKGEDSVDQATIDRLAAIFEEESYSLNPNVKKKNNFTDYYSDLVSQVGNSGMVFRDITLNQEATVSAIENARQQIMGVSNDEEMTNMVKFQNAYNASSRYINVISEMLEHIINTLGR